MAVLFARLQHLAVLKGVKKNWPKITPIKNHGRKVLLVDARYKERGEFKGERKTFLFADRAEAEGFALQQRAQRLNGLAKGDYQFISSEGKTLDDAQRFYAQYLRERTQSKLLKDAVAELLEFKANVRRVSTTRLSDIRCRLDKFAGAIGEKLIVEITETEINQFLSQFPHPVNRNNYRKEIVMLWKHAFDNKWVRSPISNNLVPELKEPRRSKEFLSVEGAARLLEASIDPELRAMNALVLFGGVRVEEVEKLDWSLIHFEGEGYIEITVEVAKKNEERMIPLQPNLHAWLLPLVKQGPVITRKVLDKPKRETWKRAGLYPWKQNAHRRSFISYYRQLHGDVKTARDAGTSEQKIKDNYKRPVQQKDAERFFQIYPPSLPDSGKIVPMPTTARSADKDYIRLPLDSGRP